jgi:hypothetical protein
MGFRYILWTFIIGLSALVSASTYAGSLLELDQTLVKKMGFEELTKVSDDRILMTDFHHKKAILISSYETNLDQRQAEGFLQAGFGPSIFKQRSEALNSPYFSTQLRPLGKIDVPGPVIEGLIYTVEFGDFATTVLEYHFWHQQKIIVLTEAAWGPTAPDPSAETSDLRKLISALVKIRRPAHELQETGVAKPEGHEAPVRQPISLFPGHHVPSEKECLDSLKAEHLSARRFSPPPGIHFDIHKFASFCPQGGQAFLDKTAGSLKKSYLKLSSDTAQRNAANHCSEVNLSHKEDSIYTKSLLMQAQSICTESAGGTAIIQQPIDWVKKTGKSVLALLHWVQTHKDPLGVALLLLDHKLASFECHDAGTQMKIYCQFVSSLAGGTVAAALTGEATAFAQGSELAEASVTEIVSGMQLVDSSAAGAALDAAALWTPKERIAKAAELLKQSISPEQEQAILKAHEVGIAEGRGFGSYTLADLKAKVGLLKRAGFNKVQARTLIENGVAGGWARTGARNLETVSVPSGVFQEDPYDLFSNQSPGSLQMFRPDPQNSRTAGYIERPTTSPKILSESHRMTTPLTRLNGRPVEKVESVMKGVVSKSEPLRISKKGINPDKQILVFPDGTKGLWKPHVMRWHSNYRAEVLAYEVDKKLGFNLVPPTVERTFDNQRGSVQLFIESDPTKKIPKSEFDKESALDFLLDSGDRHAGNYLISHDGRLVDIDNGISFTGHGGHRVPFADRAPEIDRFLRTSEGGQIIDKMRTLAKDPHFSEQIKSYLGSHDADEFMRRFQFLIQYADKKAAQEH